MGEGGSEGGDYFFFLDFGVGFLSCFLNCRCSGDISCCFLLFFFSRFLSFIVSQRSDVSSLRDLAKSYSGSESELKPPRRLEFGRGEKVKPPAFDSLGAGEAGSLEEGLTAGVPVGVITWAGVSPAWVLAGVVTAGVRAGVVTAGVALAGVVTAREALAGGVTALAGVVTAGGLAGMVLVAAAGVWLAKTSSFLGVARIMG